MADLEYLTERVRAAASTSIRTFSSSHEYLYAMKEDLADWLNTLFELELTVSNFVPRLETGVILCHLANMVRHKALEYLEDHPGVRLTIPGDADISPSGNAEPGTFRARENVAIFIDWCRRRLGVSDSLMFETNDLIEGRNERSFVLCLLEVARRGAKFGMLAPMLIQMEQEIEEEIREEAPPPPQRRVCDLSSLDDMVRELVSRCTCPDQFPMLRVDEGKYRIGNASTLVFVRVLRNHVMIRVGGGWDTLEHYLDKHDPCRCMSRVHRQPRSFGGSAFELRRPPSSSSSRSSFSPSPRASVDSGRPTRSSYEVTRSSRGSVDSGTPARTPRSSVEERRPSSGSGRYGGPPSRLAVEPGSYRAMNGPLSPSSSVSSDASDVGPNAAITSGRQKNATSSPKRARSVGNLLDDDDVKEDVSPRPRRSGIPRPLRKSNDSLLAKSTENLNRTMTKSTGNLSRTMAKSTDNLNRSLPAPRAVSRRSLQQQQRSKSMANLSNREAYNEGGRPGAFSTSPRDRQPAAADRNAARSRSDMTNKDSRNRSFDSVSSARSRSDMTDRQTRSKSQSREQQRKLSTEKMPRASSATSRIYEPKRSKKEETVLVISRNKEGAHRLQREPSDEKISYRDCAHPVGHGYAAEGTKRDRTTTGSKPSLIPTASPRSRVLAPTRSRSPDRARSMGRARQDRSQSGERRLADPAEFRSQSPDRRLREQQTVWRRDGRVPSPDRRKTYQTSPRQSPTHRRSSDTAPQQGQRSYSFDSSIESRETNDRPGSRERKFNDVRKSREEEMTSVRKASEPMDIPDGNVSSPDRKRLQEAARSPSPDRKRLTEARQPDIKHLPEYVKASGEAQKVVDGHRSSPQTPPDSSPESRQTALVTSQVPEDDVPSSRDRSPSPERYMRHTRSLDRSPVNPDVPFFYEKNDKLPLKTEKVAPSSVQMIKELMEKREQEARLTSPTRKDGRDIATIESPSMSPTRKATEDSSRLRQDMLDLETRLSPRALLTKGQDMTEKSAPILKERSDSESSCSVSSPSSDRSPNEDTGTFVVESSHSPTHSPKAKATTKTEVQEQTDIHPTDKKEPERVSVQVFKHVHSDDEQRTSDDELPTLTEPGPMIERSSSFPYDDVRTSSEDWEDLDDSGYHGSTEVKDTVELTNGLYQYTGDKRQLYHKQIKEHQKDVRTRQLETDEIERLETEFGHERTTSPERPRPVPAPRKNVKKSPPPALKTDSPPASGESPETSPTHRQRTSRLKPKTRVPSFHKLRPLIRVPSRKDAKKEIGVSKIPKPVYRKSQSPKDGNTTSPGPSSPVRRTKRHDTDDSGIDLSTSGSRTYRLKSKSPTEEYPLGSPTRGYEVFVDSNPVDEKAATTRDSGIDLWNGREKGTPESSPVRSKRENFKKNEPVLSRSGPLKATQDFSKTFSLRDLNRNAKKNHSAGARTISVSKFRYDSEMNSDFDDQASWPRSESPEGEVIEEEVAYF